MVIIMKKKLLALCLVLAMMSSLPINVSAYSDESVQVTETKAGTVYSGNNKSIEYMEDMQGYYLQNVTKEEFLEAMNNAFNTDSSLECSPVQATQVSSEFINKSNSVLAEKGIDLSSAKALTYRENYKLKTYIDGPFGDTIPLTFSVTMKMTTVTYQGEEYAMFVDFVSTSGGAVPSGPYDTTSATGEPAYEILNSGATLSASQEIQLQTTESYSEGVDFGEDWFSYSVSGSVSYLRIYYFRRSSA